MYIRLARLGRHYYYYYYYCTTWDVIFLATTEKDMVKENRMKRKTGPGFYIINTHTRVFFLYTLCTYVSSGSSFSSSSCSFLLFLFRFSRANRLLRRRTVLVRNAVWTVRARAVFACYEIIHFTTYVSRFSIDLIIKITMKKRKDIALHADHRRKIYYKIRDATIFIQ